MEKDNPSGEEWGSDPRIHRSDNQNNTLLGFGFPAALGADCGGAEDIPLDDHQVRYGDKACEGGDSLHFETEELLEAGLDRKFREEFERWIVECNEAMLALRNSCT